MICFHAAAQLSVKANVKAAKPRFSLKLNKTLCPTHDENHNLSPRINSTYSAWYSTGESPPPFRISARHKIRDKNTQIVLTGL